MPPAWIWITAALALGCPRTAPLSPPPKVEARRIVILEDDYGKALALARKRNVPLFVDAWATWCHTCLSLRAYVFPDPALLPFADKLVWASIDTEKEGNAAFLEKFPVDVWPTLFVIDPVTEKPVLKWMGTATAQELSVLLEEATTSTSGEAMAALVRGDRAAAEEKTNEAVEHYRAALAAAKPGWGRRPRVVEALSIQLLRAHDHAACVALAVGELPSMPAGTSKANVAINGLEASAKLKNGASDVQDAAKLEGAVEALASDALAKLLPDDRSSLFEVLVAHRKAKGDVDGAKKAARAWATLLEHEATSAKTAEARAVFDPHRLLAYAELGELDKCVPMFRQSEKDFPEDYNPPTRLAWVYMKLGRLDDATATIERAKKLAYGPRTLTVLKIDADIHLARGDKVGARATLEKAIALGESMKLSGIQAKVLVEIRKKLAQL